MNSIAITCKITECDKARSPGRKDWCVMHYTRWSNHGDPMTTKLDRSIPNVTKMPEYKSWQAMKERCLREQHKDYPRYGGSGVTIHKPWIKSFKVFYEHIGTRPSIMHTLDRIDNEGNYVPGNVRWATHEEQSSNRRTNIFFTLDGETKTLKQWCDLKGLKYKTVWARINVGKPFEDSLY